MDLEPKIRELLNKRGIVSETEIAEFLSDRPQKTYDPFLLLNMEAGVDLILSAIDEGKKICIYGDYDADGITSTVIMWEVLSHLTDRLMYHIPSRFDEGYGLNCDAVREIREEGADLLITVDCGSVSCEEVAYAKELGMDVLVTDHHQVTDRIADCIVINPAQPGETYPFRFLAGCGVAFKVCQALVMVTGLPKRALTSTLDLVGIGTIGDIVPLVDENRTLAKYGLRAVNTGARENLRMLIEAVGLKPGKITAEIVSFVIVPHLNAAGRMVHARIAADLFLTRDPVKAADSIRQICELNQRRKRIQQDTYEECAEMIRSQYSQDPFLLLPLRDAHEGITGIVAGKIKEEYYRPTVIVTPVGQGLCKGTGRSIEGIDIYQVLKKSEELFERFGGHKAACGFTMKEENIPALRKSIMDQMAEVSSDVWKRDTTPDLEVEGKDLTFHLAEQLSLLEPCGAGNPRPGIGVRGRSQNAARIGADGQFLRFTARLQGGECLSCIAFRNTDEIEAMFRGGRELLIAGTLGVNVWRDRRNLQLITESVSEASV